ncbi:LysR family transcriptional regulator [Cellulomonas shaoxiangyii]|uniref:LysR family transcriptional regulator n=1 Tax=Cellulomonas shaoxiangyii TaxID=2566013 RepID=A0A4P7SHQ6_9CELL|nr:LysR family transcriptional regulator [Cellulomonas shaoxiangyii]QCB92656.1 LysR family transcriptional regulator [Cellulomonas shaoxiangyii]TGY85464.1 LysR family transcriptional regulator [Cellulomonas shaoxiangyii]
MELEVRHLRMVATVAEHGSVTKAAAALGLAQPALSAQLSRIDRTLGGPVFVRDHRGVHLTPLGALVLERARTLLPAMDALVLDAHRLARCGQVPDGLRVAVVGSALAAAFARRVDGGCSGRAVLRTAWSAAGATNDLASGTHDALLVGMCADALPPAASGVHWWLVGTDAVQVLVPTDHASPDEADLAAFADERWLKAPGDSCFTACFVAACARAGFAPHAPSECDRSAGLELVRSGAGVGLAQPFGAPLDGVRAVALRGRPLLWSTWLAVHDTVPETLRAALLAAARAARTDGLAAAAGPRGLAVAPQAVRAV